MNAIATLITRDYGGEIPFEQFMDLALHHPKLGYYQTRRRPIGPRGDFTTAPVVSRLPGRAIARWARALAAKAGEGPRRRVLVEVGAGDGSLAADLLDAIGWLGRRRFRLRIVESSPTLTTIQRERLGRHARHVEWHKSMASALDDCPHPVVFHNELVDAFPCAVLEFQEGEWLEVFVAAEPDGRLSECLRPVRDKLIARWRFSALEWSPPRDGQRIEVHRAWFDWLAGWLPLCHSLDMLTIDYGARFPALYHRRPRGTLRAFLHHLGHDATSPLDHPGHQDITADVNFTDLETLASPLGLGTVSCATLADFLAPVAPRKPGPVAIRLLDPRDAGGAFHVLHQRLARQ